MTLATEIKDLTRQYKTSVEKIVEENFDEVPEEVRDFVTKVFIKNLTKISRNLISVLLELQTAKEKELTSGYIN
jgi:predicted Zn-dependent protease with MMP-like domain